MLNIEKKINEVVHLIFFRLEIPFLGKSGPENQDYQFNPF